jgi:hypothetical protein
VFGTFSMNFIILDENPRLGITPHPCAQGLIARREEKYAAMSKSTREVSAEGIRVEVSPGVDRGWRLFEVCF